MLLHWHSRPAYVMAHQQMSATGQLHVSSIDCLVTAVSLVLHLSRHQGLATWVWRPARAMTASIGYRRTTKVHMLASWILLSSTRMDIQWVSQL